MAVKENDRQTTKMKTVNSSKSQRVLEFVPSIRPSFLSVVLVLVCGCLWVKNEATNERLISLESRIYCVPCVNPDLLEQVFQLSGVRLQETCEEVNLPSEQRNKIHGFFYAGDYFFLVWVYSARAGNTTFLRLHNTANKPKQLITDSHSIRSP